MRLTFQVTPFFEPEPESYVSVRFIGERQIISSLLCAKRGKCGRDGTEKGVTLFDKTKGVTGIPENM